MEFCGTVSPKKEMIGILHQATIRRLLLEVFWPEGVKFIYHILVQFWLEIFEFG